MTGEFFKEWVSSTYPSTKAAADDFGISIPTLYTWFNRAQLTKLVVRAVAQRGCVAPEDKAWLTPKKVAKTG